MAKTISQRITLEGGEDIRKKLEELGRAGEQAFKQIQDAAKKPITDPAQIDKTRQAIGDLVQASQRLGQQYQALTTNAAQFGATGAQAGQQAAAGLNQTSSAARSATQETVKLGIVLGTIAGVVQAATTKVISLAGQLRQALAPSELLKGTVETSKAIAEQADKIGATIPQWLALRKAMTEAGVANDDMLKALEKASGVLEKAKGGTADLGRGVNELSVWSNNGTVTLQRFNDATANLTSGASRAATELAKLGISTRAAAMPEGIARYRQLADEILRLPDGAARAAAGVAVFGKNWKEVVDLLHTGQRNIDNTKQSLSEAGKAAREMSDAQVEAAIKLSKTWDDLASAVRALRDQIGALFIGGAQTKADWLVKLVDGSIALFKTWSQLAEAKKQAFLEGLGETPAEKAFKILIAVGQQLAGLWRDVLVPAGRQLLFIVAQIFGSMEGVTKSQVAAFFITATAAAVGLTIALKALQIALAPITLLFSPLGLAIAAAGAAAVVFWDQIVAGAKAAAELIPNSLALIAQSFRRLFAGDFRGFWRDFSEGAVAAFQTIAQAIMQTEGPVGDLVRSLVAGLQQIGTDGPAAIQLVLAALVALGRAATLVADIINKLFGTQLTGTDIAIIAIIASMTGALAALASIATIVGAAIGAMAAVIGGQATIAILGAIAVITALIANFDRVNAAGTAAWNAIAARWSEVVAGITADINNLTAVFQAVWQSFANFAMAAFDTVTNGVTAVIDAITNAINALLNLLGLGNQVGQGGAIANPAAPGAFASGGFIGGRGTGTSDSNLAWVSRGEHIMPARAVRQPGVLAFLEALRRSGGNLSRVLDRMGHFAMGGLVTAPAFASGGMNNVTIQFPGLPAIGGLRAPSDVVEELRKAAAMAQVRSGGRKPSRYS